MAFVFSEDGATPLEEYSKPKWVILSVPKEHLSHEVLNLLLATFPKLDGDPGCVISCHLKKLCNRLHNCLHNAYSFVRWCPGRIDRFA